MMMPRACGCSRLLGDGGTHELGTRSVCVRHSYRIRAPQCHGPYSRFKRSTCCHSQPKPSPAEGDDPGGNKEVQEALLESLRLGIKREQTKEEVEQSFQIEVQKLREIADQAKEELEAVARLNSMRQDLAFGSTLADLLQDVDQLEEELKKSRQQTEADQREFEQWERDTNLARSEGLFFKSLYPVSEKPQGAAGAEGQGSSSGSSGSSSSSSSSTPGAGGDASERVKAALEASAGTRQVLAQATEEEVTSPWRLYLLTYMVGVLLLFATYDLLRPAPSFTQDGVLGAVAVLLGIAAWNERQAVIALSQKGLLQRGSNSASSASAVPAATQPAAGDKAASGGEDKAADS